jgi:hypothetical protein
MFPWIISAVLVVVIVFLAVRLSNSRKDYNYLHKDSYEFRNKLNNEVLAIMGKAHDLRTNPTNFMIPFDEFLKHFPESDRYAWDRVFTDHRGNKGIFTEFRQQLVITFRPESDPGQSEPTRPAA